MDTDVGESRAEGDDGKMAMGETTTAEASRNQPHGLSTISAAVSKLAFSFVGTVSKKTAAQRPASSRMRNNPQEALSAALLQLLWQCVARALRGVRFGASGE